MEKEIIEKGVIVAVNSGSVEVEILRGEGCGSCSMHGLCFPAKKNSVLHIKSDLALEKEMKWSWKCRQEAASLPHSSYSPCLFSFFS